MRVRRKSHIGTSRLLGTGSSSTRTSHKPNRREEKMTKKDIPSNKFWNLVMKIVLEARSPTGRRGRNRYVMSFEHTEKRRRRKRKVISSYSTRSRSLSIGCPFLHNFVDVESSLPLLVKFG